MIKDYKSSVNSDYRFPIGIIDLSVAFNILVVLTVVLIVRMGRLKMYVVLTVGMSHLKM